MRHMQVSKRPGKSHEVLSQLLLSTMSSAWAACLPLPMPSETKHWLETAQVPPSAAASRLSRVPSLSCVLFFSIMWRAAPSARWWRDCLLFPKNGKWPQPPCIHGAELWQNMSLLSVMSAPAPVGGVGPDHWGLPRCVNIRVGRQRSGFLTDCSGVVCWSLPGVVRGNCTQPKAACCWKIKGIAGNSWSLLGFQTLNHTCASICFWFVPSLSARCSVPLPSSSPPLFPSFLPFLPSARGQAPGPGPNRTGPGHNRPGNASQRWDIESRLGVKGRIPRDTMGVKKLLTPPLCHPAQRT